MTAPVMALPIIDDAGFAAAVAGPGLVLALFTAAWCLPCERVLPEVGLLAADLGARAAVVTVDIDAAPRAATGHRVRGVPLLMAFRDGAAVGSIMGFRRRAVLRGFVDGLEVK